MEKSPLFYRINHEWSLRTVNMEEHEPCYCILCHRKFGDQPGQTQNKCSLKRVLDSKIDGALTLSQLINEVLDIEFEQRLDEEELSIKNMYTCLQCANAMLLVKIKRKHLLMAEEKVLSMKSASGYIGTFTRLMSRKRQMSSPQMLGTSKRIQTSTPDKQNLVTSKVIETSTPAEQITLKVHIESPHSTPVATGETSGNQSSSSSTSSSSSASSSTKKRQRHSFSPKKIKGYRIQISNSIFASRYGRAFKLAYNKSSRAKQEIIDAVRQMGRMQMAVFVQKGKSLKQELNRDKAENFNWSPIFSELQERLPILCAVLEGSLVTRANSEQVHIDKDGEKIGDLVPGMGVVLSMITKMRRPKKFNLVPSLLGMTLFKNGCRTSLLTTLSKIGLCMTAKSMRRIVARCGEWHNDKILAVKGPIQAVIQNEGTEEIAEPESESDIDTDEDSNLDDSDEMH